ncbi:replication-associated recombination protein A [[Ruminococcus] torques]|uniref:replication-associated recombination protein A n=1 Tax=[Ruminococcus] torques TaxID=33039 RepID=UPI0025A429AE|nr:replication-associated recombination protein A [[Ruminococcus] torques]MDM8236892.1 replication-associated recombination protein A [[Ruminococcus] torques]
MDLFDYMREKEQEKESPLASRMRPSTLEEVVGQQHIIGRDKLLYRAIKADKLSSVIFYGPPGTGKTTLAKVIANTTSAEFKQINATVAGKKDMEEVVRQAKDLQGMYGKKTILFIDEIHRFNKGQQDYLLPFVEDGTVILIGATTENPYFEVNGALLSRSSIFELKPLEKEDIKTLLRRAVNDTDKGLGSFHAVIDEDALEFLADMSGGDARNALNAVELGVLTTERSEDGIIHITMDVASECIQKRAVNYDKRGDNHYDIISAFIKSMRGSDPDAAVYYLAKMLYAGEDVKFIARRIMICASEDVGNADPMALTVAVSAAQAVERIGMPESQIILSQAVTYVACAPKSNSAVNAISAANNAVRTYQTSVPSHLRDAHYKGAGKLGHGIGYKYAHDYPGHYVDQQYLPDEIKDARFYEPGDLGYEKNIKEYLQKIRGAADE